MLQKVVRTKKEEKCFHQNMRCVIVKNRDLLKSKKLVIINYQAIY